MQPCGDDYFYEIDDLMDEFCYEASRLIMTRGTRGKCKQVYEHSCANLNNCIPSGN